ncbi:MAG: exodeoxyribonuclease V subunit gamma [Lachnospiraceae bacterium]|nr:exodeoxyribonuclease V subunit gamma [Lachnospiraceae bacterium]
MALRMVYGASGSGKSYNVYKRMIAAAEENPQTSYILLCPEQYSMMLQRKMALLSPKKGYMNIDVIGLNRLAYHVFDELNVSVKDVLEDFGKTMLIRLAAGKVRDELVCFKNSIDKPGFTDEVKSLLSEVYQYDCEKEQLKAAAQKLLEDEQNQVTGQKLSNLVRIFEEFEKSIESRYIVAEQINSLLAQKLAESELIKNSEIVIDGFTGFTPVQLDCVRGLIKYAKNVTVLITMDEENVSRNRIAEHELFYLSKSTAQQLLKIADEERITILPQTVIERNDNMRFKKDGEIAHLERNLFRYPYSIFKKETEEIKLYCADTPREELIFVADEIRRMVAQEGLRYRDIAVICAGLQDKAELAEQVFPLYNIPFFADMNYQLKNNPYVDGLLMLLAMLREDFTYETVFSFLKLGIIDTVADEECDTLENFVLAKKIRGFSRWKKEWGEPVEETRLKLVETVAPIREAIGGKRKRKAATFADGLLDFMVRLSYEEKLCELPGLYEKLTTVLDKIKELMPEETLSPEEFASLFATGLSDISLGRVPGSLDTVILGDITRTRLDGIKVLFILGMNDGIIPAKAAKPGLINDHEKERLEAAGIRLAPTDRMNSYIEQFYLYLNMTKPSEKLILSYTLNSELGDELKPSYVTGRIKRMFPGLKTEYVKAPGLLAKNVSMDEELLGRELCGISSFQTGISENAGALYKAVGELAPERLDRLMKAAAYNNLPGELSEDVREITRLKLISKTVSRLEQFASCAYAYFLKYTIGLKERKTDIFEFSDIGIILHDAMENTFKYIRDKMGNNLAGISDTQLDELADRFTRHACDKHYDGVDVEPGRYDALKSTMMRVGRRTARMLSFIGKNDGFKPYLIEYAFDCMLPIEGGDKLKLAGRIDRADVKVDEATGNKYIRVLDFKTGAKEIKMSELYEGLTLQLAVYTDALLAELKSKGENVKPEGMYYYQIRDPYVDAKDEADAQTKREKTLTIKGIEADEGEFFKTVLKYAKHEAAELSKQMTEGRIDKNPIKKSDDHPCSYCSFKDVCRFDERIDANKLRRLKFPSTKEGDIDAYVAMSKKLGGKADGMD